MSEKIIIEYFKTPVWEIILGSYDDKLCLADWRYRKMRSQIDARISKLSGRKYQEWTSEVLETAKKQLQEYFAGKRTQFDIPLCFLWTDFQKNVWKSLMKIGFWETKSYWELSEILWDKKAVRAVATANGANAISIIVPCHRIIWKNGDLVWYAWWLTAKKKLLELENSTHRQQLWIF